MGSNVVAVPPMPADGRFAIPTQSRNSRLIPPRVASGLSNIAAGSETGIWSLMVRAAGAFTQNALSFIGLNATFGGAVLLNADPVLPLGAATRQFVEASTGDQIYVSDSRTWLGGLRSIHLRAGPPHGGSRALLNQDAFKRANFLAGKPVTILKTI